MHNYIFKRQEDIAINSTKEELSEAAEENLLSVLPILFLLLIAGSVIRFGLSKFSHRVRPPFTVVLFVFGFIISLVRHFTYNPESEFNYVSNGIASL
jgi:uncharacterized membrane protein YoaK (UPF0700 family)